MRKLLFIWLTGIYLLSVSAEEITRMEPAFWWVGMKNPELQLLVYGDNIATSRVNLDYPGVRLKDVVKVDNPNYLFLYLDMDSEASPGVMDLVFSNEKKSFTYKYELKPRSTSSGAMGFTCADAIYLITPDRFANENLSNDNLDDVKVNRSNPYARHGGDIAGITRHLDYISDLGFTTVWLNPVLENRQPGGSYHGYAITDFYKVDPRFGTNEEYCSMIDKAHRKGLKVVMDMIFNHCGSEHWWMKDFPTSDWLNHQDSFKQTTHFLWPILDVHAPQSEIDAAVDGWFGRGMPDLNQRNKHLATYLIQNSIWWIEYARIDGIRQDTHPYADFDFMAQWCKAVEIEYPDFNIVGEAWYSRVLPVAWWQKNSKISPRESYLKTVMDFGLTFTCQEVFTVEQKEKKALNPGNFDGLGKLYELIAQDFVYADMDNILIFLDNHDLSRFMKKDETDLRRYKQALAFLLTTRGIPQIYYGMELLMSGEKKEGDGLLRKDFPGGWPDDPVDAYTREGRTALQNEAWNYMQKLLVWRKNNKAVSGGKLVHYAPDHTGCYVYARMKQDATVLVIMNGTEKDQTLPMNRFKEVLGNKTSGKEIISSHLLQVNEKIDIPAKGVYIIELM